jgi:hydroxyacylglutathione hydrolase
VNDQQDTLARVVSTPFEENTYIVSCAGRDDCLVVDPGLEPEKITAYLDEHRLTPAAILITHGHSDHIAGNAALKHRWPDCPIIVGVEDAPKLTDPRLNLSAMFGASIISPPADRTVRHGERFTAAGIDIEVLELPGHSAGHVVYVRHGRSPLVAFVGDVVFAGSIGRTDFPDGNYRQLLQSIVEKLFTLPDDTILLSGHGPPTTVGREKQDNPFVGQR